MSHQNPPQSAGFTLIEALFVLMISGLIMLLVFEAIPTLTRNGRNNDRKQDIATVLEAVSHYELTNSGNIPPACTGAVDNGPILTCEHTFLQNAKMHYYELENIQVTPQTASTAADITSFAD